MEEKGSELVKPAIPIIKAPRGREAFKVLHDADMLRHLFTPILFQAHFDIINEDVEVPYCGGIRVVLGRGGEVKYLFMPEEFRSIFVDKPDKKASEETVISKFSKFGKIKDHRIFKSPLTRWGCITFESASDAALAVQATKEDESEVAVPERSEKVHQESDFTVKDQYSDFRVKVSWCRRESIGFVLFDDVRTNLLRRLRVFNKERRLVRFVIEQENGRILLLGNFGEDVNEDDIKYAFSEQIPNGNLDRVAIVREKVDENVEDMEAIAKELTKNIEEFVPRERFALDLKHPRHPYTVKHRAFVTFKNANDGILSCEMMSQDACIQNRVVTMEPQIQSSIFIHHEIYVAVKDDLDSYLKEYLDVDDSEVEITSKRLPNGTGTYLTLESSNTVELTKILARLQDFLQGDVLDCEANPHVQYLFNRSGQHFLQDVAKECYAYIQADYRNLTISIRGKQASITMARSALNGYLSSIGTEDWKEVTLKGNGMPRGLMKTLMNGYGLKLEQLQLKTRLKLLTLNFKQQIIKMIGSAEAIDKTVAVIDEVCASIQEGSKKWDLKEGLPNCCICLCPIDDKDLYRLECCWHAYCIDCLTLQVEFHLKTRNIPISCVEKDCGKTFMWRDLSFLAEQGSFTINSIAQSSVNSYVIANSKNIKYCLTPDCNMVYKVTTTGAVFRCPECNMKICTSCHTQYHERLTCAMLRSARENFAFNKDT